MMKVKGAYYVPNLPNSVVIVLPDDTVWAVNTAPFRIIKEDEMSRLPAYEIPAYRKNVLTQENEVFEFCYFQYGLEKIK